MKGHDKFSYFETQNDNNDNQAECVYIIYKHRKENLVRLLSLIFTADFIATLISIKYDIEMVNVKRNQRKISRINKILSMTWDYQTSLISF